jgi:RimJ/RimL family protein N-acetyltransferase
MLRYAFGALGMRRVGLTHSDGNEASRRIAEKLGFVLVGVDRAANPLPGGLIADRFRYERFGTEGLPPLEVQWGNG